MPIEPRLVLPPSRRVLALLALPLAALIGTCIVLQDRPAERAASASDSPSMDAAARAPAVTGTDPAVGVKAEAAAAPRAALPPPPSLAVQMLQAGDLRAFAGESLQHPEAGGVSYAIYASLLCRKTAAALAGAGVAGLASLPYAAPEDPRAYALRNASFQRAVAACRSYPESELSAAERTRLTERAASAQDEFYRLSGLSLAAATSAGSAQRERVLDAVLRNGDPLLLHIVLPKLVAAAALEQGGPPGAEGDDGGVIERALQVLPCRLGLVCDARSADVLLSCLRPETCASGRVELARASLAEPLRPAFDQALARFESAAREHRTAAFFVP